jgi:hypothetical protein
LSLSFFSPLCNEGPAGFCHSLLTRNDVMGRKQSTILHFDLTIKP